MSDTGQFRTVAQRPAVPSGYPLVHTPVYVPHSAPPSGLFPARQLTDTPRPVYRELHPVTAGKAAIGVLAGTLWMGLFGLLATSARGYVWWTIIAAVLAWPVLAVLSRFGDRGVAVGAAVSTGFGLAIAGIVVMVRTFAGDSPLW